MDTKSGRFNSIEAFRRHGETAGIASSRGDEAGNRWERDWLRKALAIEPPDYRAAARQAFDDAYRAATASRIR